jgi:O-succinylbenzoate synthase
MGGDAAVVREWRSRPSEISLGEQLTSRPGLEVLQRSAVPFAVALRGSFRGVHQRQGVLIRGPKGWGEFAPFEDYSDERAARWLSSAIEAAFIGWPQARRSRVPTNAILPVRSIEVTRSMVQRAVVDLGCRTIKVKVADSIEEPRQELHRIGSVRAVLDDLLGVGVGRIRLDANGGWSAPEALARIEAVSDYGIEYVEQPCRSLADMATVKQSSSLPIAADEAIRVDGVVDGIADFADVAVLKAAPLGGVASALQVAERLGVPAVVSGSMDTSVGLSAAIALAGALPECAYDCGLATGTLLAEDLTTRTTVPERGLVTVERAQPDHRKLAAAQARLSRSEREAWFARLERALSFLPADMAERLLDA